MPSAVKKYIFSITDFHLLVGALPTNPPTLPATEGDDGIFRNRTIDLHAGGASLQEMASVAEVTLVFRGTAYDSVDVVCGTSRKITADPKDTAADEWQEAGAQTAYPRQRPTKGPNVLLFGLGGAELLYFRADALAGGDMTSALDLHITLSEKALGPIR